MKKEGFRIDLRGEEVDIFHQIKNRHNLETNVDVFRHALAKTNEIEVTGTSDRYLHPQLRYVVERLLERSDIQEKFGIHNEEELVKLAVDRLLTDIVEFSRTRSLLHWDVRKSLQGSQKEVALKFKELEMESTDGTVSLDRLSSSLSWEKGKVKRIMDEFVYQSLVDREIMGEHTLYHAN